MLDDALDVDKQVSNMQQLLAQKVKAIVFYPLDPKAMTPVLDQAKKQGVPVVAIDAGFGNPKTRRRPASAHRSGRAATSMAFLQVQALARRSPARRSG